MHSVGNHVGRLIEIELGPPIATADLTDLRDKLAAAVKQALAHPPGKAIVIVLDARPMRIFPPEVADGLVEVMKTVNPHLERGGYLVGDSKLFAVQADRVLREAGNVARRLFSEAEQLAQWLEPVLRPEERTQLRKFLHASGG